MPNEQAITGHNQFEADFFELPVSMPHGGPGHPVKKRRHFPACAALRKALEILAARIHQGNNDRGKLLSEGDCGGHRERGNDIEAYLAASKARDDLDKEHEQHRDGECRPDKR